MIPYEDLERHFTSPKTISPFFKDVTRVPRKFKKKWKHILCGNKYHFLDLGQKLWYIQHLTNVDYNRFLIKQVIHNETNNKEVNEERNASEETR